MYREEARQAVFSHCGLYRFYLERRWADGPLLIWMMLNPSTADGDTDDPTIRVVRGFTKREGYPGFGVVNVWALRATTPRELHQKRSAFEPKNIDYIRAHTRGADVVVAWGGSMARGPGLQHAILALDESKTLRCLGLTKSGQPRHPLRLARGTPLQPWRGVTRTMRTTSTGFELRAVED